MQTHHIRSKCYSPHGAAIRSRRPIMLEVKITRRRSSPSTQSLQEQKLRESTRLHTVLSMIHDSFQSQRYVWKKLTKRSTVPLLWLVPLLSRCPSCIAAHVTASNWLVAGMRHDDHNAGGTSSDSEFHVTRAHVDAPPPNKAEGILAASRLANRGHIWGLG